MPAPEELLRRMDERGATPVDPAALFAESSALRSLARELVRDRALAEDVVQDAWVAALEHPPRLEPGRGGARAWIAAVVANLARRAGRREARRPAVERRAARAEAESSARELVERMELQKNLAEAVLLLEEPYREAVLLRHLDGLDARAIATRQGGTAEAARQRVARGLARLRATLERRHGRDWAVALARVTSGAEGPWLTAAQTGGLLMATKGLALLVGGAAAATVAVLWWAARPGGAGGPASAAPAGTTATLASSVANGIAGEGLLEAGRVGERETLLPPAPEVTPAFRGRILDRQGRPIAKANAVLASDAAAAHDLVARGLSVSTWAVAAADGSFRLDAPEAGPRTLYFEAPEFLPASEELAPEQASDVVLARPPELTLVLVGPKGEVPLGPRRVDLWIRDADGVLQRSSVEAKASDAPGCVRARGLLSGRVERVAARARGFGPVERALDLALEPDFAGLLELELPTGVLVHGIVLDASTREPVPDADVWAEEAFFDENSSRPTARSDAHGNFELLGVAPDTEDAPDYMWTFLSAQAEGYVGGLLHHQGWQRSDTERYWAELLLTRSDAALSGHVRWPDGAPVFAARLMLVDAQSQMHFLGTDATGAFAAEGLPPGTVALLAVGDAREQRAALRTEIELAAGETRTADLVLEPADATVTGLVLDADDHPIPGASLRLDLHMRTEKLAFVADQEQRLCDEGGRFTFEHAFPGRHALTLENLPPSYVAAPAPDLFDLARGETRELALRAAPGIPVAGWVDLADRDPASLRVVAFTASGAHLTETVIAADATFRFAPLYPDDLELVLYAGEEELARAKVGPKGASDVVLRVP